MLLKNETLETVHLKQNRLFRGMHSKLKSFKKLPATNPVKVIMNGAQYAPPTPRLKNNPEDKKKRNTYNGDPCGDCAKGLCPPVLLV